ncbi:MAG: FKBP-type peptidyl-prolyl cis-trans isomerase [Proteobacteria bacterium]|nr:FKBP-type peptidyl-prolyl cis-trans isomerase [Pseudomonadota bacterium]
MNLKSKISVIAISLLFTHPLFAKSAIPLNTETEKVSYTIGVSIGSNLKRQSVPVKLEALIAGIQDAIEGKEPRMSSEEMQKTMQAFGEKMKAKMGKKNSASAGENLKQGQDFLKRNKLKKSVITLPSGLQYEIIRDGKGQSPQLTDSVEAHYRGTLLNGEEFDSSYSRGKPSTFPVGGVIKGWTEALQLMKIGSKWKLYIPSDLAYGQRGAGAKIGPNSTLIFEVELINIK